MERDLANKKRAAPDAAPTHRHQHQSHNEPTSPGLPRVWSSRCACSVTHLLMSGAVGICCSLHAMSDSLHKLQLSLQDQSCCSQVIVHGSHSVQRRS